ncbi:TetR/AcrR family transcriptional regulator [Kribbella sp. NPDC058245]|uniref:TetR/AcrR family transcriptional regulator n=1 Tax=Kribbella sp. NPDC058245 TaxID=3346399 RepID=UPI0036EC381E
MTPPRRRYGAELEAALLTAAWDELIETGYARLTMESVAVRAHTSEPVLYRRWANKDELVLAAFERHRKDNPIEVPDTGALRTDMLAYLASASHALAGFFAIATAATFSGFLVGRGLTPAQVRTKVMDPEALVRSRAIYQRAHDRGELDLDHLADAVLDLPFELIRHDLLMHLEPPGPARIRAIVDDVFLPLTKQPPTATPSRRGRSK